MKVIYTSRLSEVKSVFNSEADNVQYYNVLKNSNCLKFYNVELAKPIVRKSKGEIIWQSETVLELKSLSELSEDQRIRYGEHLEKFFQNFQSRVSRFNNISKDFVKNVMEIPDWNSVLVNEDQDYIVIVNWGFLEDKFNRKEGIIETLFPVPDQSILVKVINEHDKPITNQNIDLILADSKRSDVTNGNGYARFGTLTRGESFILELKNKVLNKTYTFDFICDGRQEYIIQTKENVAIKVIVKDKYGNPVKNKKFYLNSPLFVNEEFNTKQLGLFNFNHKISRDSFEIADEEGKIVLKEQLPFEDSTFFINYNEESVHTQEEVIPIVEPKSDLTKLVFFNAFNKPLKSLSVELKTKTNTFKRVTNNAGEITVDLGDDTSSNLNFSFNRYRELWEGSLKLDQNKSKYIIKTKPLFPWLWWLLILLLIMLLWCCAIGNCFCNDTSISNSNNYYKSEEVNKPNQEELLISACDVQTVSGGHGVTRTKHVLGSNSGNVKVLFNMQNIPDKLEVFYQGKRVTSTYEIDGNQNGFVGGNLYTGDKNMLSFDYKKDVEDFVVVVITGFDQDTSWEYLISCPK